MQDGRVLYFEDYQHLFRGKLNVSTICPFCNDTRDNVGSKSFSINTQTGAYHCFHCEAKGYLKSKYEETQKAMNGGVKEKKQYVVPKPVEQERVGKYGDSLLEYFKSRGISKTTLELARVTQESMFSHKQNRNVACIGFNFFDGGTLVNVKKRTRDKEFQLVAGAKNIPYNLNGISDISYIDGETRYAIITEGEMDALTYIECGLTHVVSVPNGANKNLEWLDDYIDQYFNPLEVIYISSDNDHKGLELREELLHRFGRDRCKVVEYPRPCKDINEVLMQYGRDAVVECFDNARELRPEGINELSDIEQPLDYLFANGFQKGAQIGLGDFDNLMSFRTGMLTIITGVPSHGKTYFLNFALIRLNMIHGWKVAFFSPEFYPVHEHVAQIIETIGGRRFGSRNYSNEEYSDLKDYVDKNFFWLDPDDTDINSVMERAKYLIRRRGIKSLVIDPFNALTDSARRNQKTDEYISDFLQKLRWFARKYDVEVFIVMHPTKLSKMENGLYPVCDLYNCKGASEIYDKADVGLTVWRNEKLDYAEVHVTKMKFRHLGGKGKSTFKFCLLNGRYKQVQPAEDDLDASVKGIPINFDSTNWLYNMRSGNGIDNDNVQIGIGGEQHSSSVVAHESDAESVWQQPIQQNTAFESSVSTQQPEEDGGLPPFVEEAPF